MRSIPTQMSEADKRKRREGPGGRRSEHERLLDALHLRGHRAEFRVHDHDDGYVHPLVLQVDGVELRGTQHELCVNSRGVVLRDVWVVEGQYYPTYMSKKTFRRSKARAANGGDGFDYAAIVSHIEVWLAHKAVAEAEDVSRRRWKAIAKKLADTYGGGGSTTVSSNESGVVVTTETLSKEEATEVLALLRVIVNRRERRGSAEEERAPDGGEDSKP